MRRIDDNIFRVINKMISGIIVADITAPPAAGIGHHQQDSTQ